MPCEKSFWTRKNLLCQNCSHPPTNAFLIDFGVILRSYIEILRAKARRKIRKCIVVGQFGSAPVRLANSSADSSADSLADSLADSSADSLADGLADGTATSLRQRQRHRHRQRRSLDREREYIYRKPPLRPRGSRQNARQNARRALRSKRRIFWGEGGAKWISCAKIHYAKSSRRCLFLESGANGENCRIFGDDCIKICKKMCYNGVGEKHFNHTEVYDYEHTEFLENRP